MERMGRMRSKNRGESQTGNMLSGEGILFIYIPRIPVNCMNHEIS